MFIILRDEINKQIGLKIRAIRKNSKLTLSELGQKVQLDESVVRRYEIGEIKNVSIDIIIKFATALHTTPTYLIGWEDDKNNVSSHESTMIKKYRALDERGKQAVDNTLDREYEFVKPKIEESAIS